MKKMFVIDTPKDCLHCKLRACIHIDGKYYQLCGLQIPRYGYCTEAFFNSEDLVDGYISEECPLEDYKNDK